MKQDGFYRYERRVGSFARTISLPEGVTEDGIRASHANGVLEVRVRKPEETKPRRIEIGVQRHRATLQSSSDSAPTRARPPRRRRCTLSSASRRGGLQGRLSQSAGATISGSGSRPASRSRSPSLRSPANIRLLTVPSGTPSCSRELRLREPAVVRELERLPLVGGQLPQRRLHRTAAVAERHLVLRCGDVPRRARQPMPVGAAAARGARCRPRADGRA